MNLSDQELALYAFREAQLIVADSDAPGSDRDHRRAQDLAKQERRHAGDRAAREQYWTETSLGHSPRDLCMKCSTTKIRTADERFGDCLRWSISFTSAVTFMRFNLAISCNASQNSSSMDRLVIAPLMRSVCFRADIRR